MMLTSEQIRAGRAILRWSARELAERAKLSLNTIQRIEALDGVPSAHTRTLHAVAKTFDDHGIDFVPNGAINRATGRGVCLITPPAG